MRAVLRHLLLVTMLGLGPVLVRAQESPLLDRISLHSGFAANWVPVKLPSGGNALSPTPIYYNLVVNGSYLLAHSNDTYSLSVDVSASVSPFIIFNSGPSEFYFQPGAFLMGRAWGGSTRYNEQKLGLGAGIGYTYSYLQVPLLVQGRDYQLTQWYAAPTAVGEVTLNTNSGSGYSLRVQYVVAPPEEVDPLLGRLTYEGFSVGLLVRMR